MACFQPMVAYRERLTGQVAIGYRLAGSGDKLELPCGKCVGCRLERARSWTVRIGHEAQLYDRSVFVTLDYRPECLRSLSLEYGDFQRFLKRLRKRLVGVSALPDGRKPIRFFVAGEYGDRYQRPHWHAILFNCWFPDSVKLRNGTFSSDVAESIWQNGRAVIGEVTPASAAYVAGYTLHKAHKHAREYEEDLVNRRTGELSGRRPEFVEMSRRPGIGAEWYKQFKSDLWCGDSAIVDGKGYKVPRYYYERLKREDPLSAEEVSYERYLRACEVPAEEETSERLRVREEFTEARVKFYGERRQ